MYRLTLKCKAFGGFNKETERIDTYDAMQHFDCDTVQQLTGLLEFMIETSDDVLELRIVRRERDE